MLLRGRNIACLKGLCICFYFDKMSKPYQTPGAFMRTFTGTSEVSVKMPHALSLIKISTGNHVQDIKFPVEPKGSESRELRGI